MKRTSDSRQGAKLWYKNATLIAGVVLLLLGAGNWITGTIRLREHESAAAAAMQATTSGASEERGRSSREELEIARVRMDFYHVVASGGRFMTAAGLILATFGLARSLRPRARRS